MVHTQGGAPGSCCGCGSRLRLEVCNGIHEAVILFALRAQLLVEQSLEVPYLVSEDHNLCAISCWQTANGPLVYRRLHPRCALTEVARARLHPREHRVHICHRLLPVQSDHGHFPKTLSRLRVLLELLVRELNDFSP